MSFGQSWTDAQWRVTAENWIAAVLEPLGLKISAELVPLQARPWSIVLRVPTQREILFFKASGPGLRHEPGFTSWLAAQFPALVPEVLAFEPESGWMLQRSAGERLRESVGDQDLLECWRQLLPAYGEMQRKLTAKVDQLLALELPDRRPARLAAHLRRWRQELVQSEASNRLLTTNELANLAAIQSEVEAVCQQLATLPPACSINHGDLHDGNVGVADDGFRIFDWGDVSLSHPFFSLRSTFVSLESRLGWVEGDPRFDQLKHKYLKAWRPNHAEDDLERAFLLSSKVWSIGTALGWERALRAAPEATRSEYNHVLPSLLRELLLAFDQEIDQPV